MAMAVATACAATRPHYGGVLRVETRSALPSADPRTTIGAGSAQEKVALLAFETLVWFDGNGNLQPKLATGWQHSPDYKRWELEIRAGVRFNNGQLLTSALAAESLRRSLAGTVVNASTENGHLVVEGDVPLTSLLAELARARNAIALRAANGELIGTGPFKLVAARPGEGLSLRANDAYWQGRPYLDGIEITPERSPRDQAIDLELGKADVVELQLDQTRQAQQVGERVVSSAPMELIALRFNPGSPAARDERVRRALALSIDRGSIAKVLLQRQAEPAAALLPQWMTGYAFLFPIGRNLEQAREEQLKAPSLILNYDFADGSAKAIAERIAVNAREAGIVVQTVGENLAARTGNGDAAIVRLRLESIDPRSALENAAVALSIQAPEELQRARTPEQLYRAESAMLADHRVIPIAHAPESYGLGARVKNWATTAEGGWRLEDVWLTTGDTAGAPAAGRP